MSKTIEIDGSLGEGGGQVLRTSLALSLITGRAFHLRNIRARRPKPGLQAQHLTSVQAAAKIGAAKLRGAKLGSCDLAFEPGQVSAGDYRFPIGTAGATSLVLQTIYLPLALTDAPSTISIEGGTHVKASPCYHFLERSWNVYLKALGINVELSMERAGFYPRGGGTIDVRITPTAVTSPLPCTQGRGAGGEGSSGTAPRGSAPSPPTPLPRSTGGEGSKCPRIQPFQGITTTSIRNVEIVAGSAGLPEHVADRMATRAAARLGELGIEFATRRETWKGGPGCMLGIELPTEPAPTFLFSLGEKGKPAETVADEAVRQVEAYLTSQPLGVDVHSADQLLLPLALADGPSTFRVSAISSHLLTNAEVIGRFIDRSIACAGAEGESGVVTVK